MSCTSGRLDVSVISWHYMSTLLSRLIVLNFLNTCRRLGFPARLMLCAHQTREQAHAGMWFSLPALGLAYLAGQS